jgi:enoyl-[acyl-carrier-protein] reductase (NADH)
VVGELQSLVEQIKSKGRRSSIYIADVSVEDSVKNMVEDIVKEYGGLDVVSQSLSFPARWLKFLCADGCKCWNWETRNDC